MPNEHEPRPTDEGTMRLTDLALLGIGLGYVSLVVAESFKPGIVPQPMLDIIRSIYDYTQI